MTQLAAAVPNQLAPITNSSGGIGPVGEYVPPLTLPATLRLGDMRALFVYWALGQRTKDRFVHTSVAADEFRQLFGGQIFHWLTRLREEFRLLWCPYGQPLSDNLRPHPAILANPVQWLFEPLNRLEREAINKGEVITVTPIPKELTSPKAPTASLGGNGLRVLSVGDLIERNGTMYRVEALPGGGLTLVPFDLDVKAVAGAVAQGLTENGPKLAKRVAPGSKPGKAKPPKSRSRKPVAKSKGKPKAKGHASRREVV